MNYAKGILESRKQHYKHLKNLLVRLMMQFLVSISQGLQKPVPLDTPTTIELSPGRRIRVTLLDVGYPLLSYYHLLILLGQSLPWCCHVPH